MLIPLVSFAFDEPPESLRSGGSADLFSKRNEKLTVKSRHGGKYPESDPKAFGIICERFTPDVKRLLSPLSHLPLKNTTLLSRNTPQCNRALVGGRADTPTSTCKYRDKS